VSAISSVKEGNPMMLRTAILCCWITALSSAGPALAQVDLSTYADGNGYLDVQKLTCAQLANTFQEDADYLTVWYSGWYNGLAKKHMMHVDRAKSLEHQIIVHCKANPGKKVIEAIDVVFKNYRDEKGIKLK
jgi:hypothetical protein